MKINDLEKIAICSILDDNGESYPEGDWFEELVVSDRFYTGVGCVTEFSRDEFLLLDCKDSTFSIDCDILLNEETLIGFIYFVKNGCLDSVEFYTYEESWPNPINTVLKIS